MWGQRRPKDCGLWLREDKKANIWHGRGKCRGLWAPARLTMTDKRPQFTLWWKGYSWFTVLDKISFENQDISPLMCMFEIRGLKSLKLQLKIERAGTPPHWKLISKNRFLKHFAWYDTACTVDALLETAVSSFELISLNIIPACF